MVGSGGCEIRTHGEVKPHAGFQDLCLKPLGQPSGLSASHRPVFQANSGRAPRKRILA